MIEVLGKFHGIPGVFVASLFCGTLRYSVDTYHVMCGGCNALMFTTEKENVTL